MNSQPSSTPLGTPSWQQNSWMRNGKGGKGKGKGDSKPGMAPVFFKGNKSKEQAGGSVAPQESSDNQNEYRSITDSLLDEDNMDSKLLREAEMDEMDEAALDRQWYDAEEGGIAMAGDTADDAKLKEKEEKLKKQMMTLKRQDLLRKAKNEANEMWENK